MKDLPPILAIDPGPVQSAFCVLTGQWILAETLPNEEVLQMLQYAREHATYSRLALEMVASYGMPVGKEVFDTVLWTGRFIQAWGGENYELIPRLDVKLHLCHDSRAKDCNIRRALLDRYGPPGTKRDPGLTYGLVNDQWAALAVAVTCAEVRLGVPATVRP